MKLNRAKSKGIKYKIILGEQNWFIRKNQFDIVVKNKGMMQLETSFQGNTIQINLLNKFNKLITIEQATFLGRVIIGDRLEIQNIEGLTLEHQFRGDIELDKDIKKSPLKIKVKNGLAMYELSTEEVKKLRFHVNMNVISLDDVLDTGRDEREYRDYYEPQLMSLRQKFSQKFIGSFERIEEITLPYKKHIKILEDKIRDLYIALEAKEMLFEDQDIEDFLKSVDKLGPYKDIYSNRNDKRNSESGVETL